MKTIQFLISSFKIQNSKLLITNSTFLILLATSLFSESYKEHRVDDLNYANNGRKAIQNKGRIETSGLKKKKSDTNESQDNSKGELLLSSYITPKFYSQKGGDKQDLAGRYANQFIFSPELVGYKQTNNMKYMLLVSPILSYRENFQLKRNVNRLVDTELIVAWKLNNKEINLNLEGGRGFQRLDAYGMLFAGMANYIETNFYWKSFDTTLSFLAISYNFNQKNLSLRDNDTNDKLMGGNLLFRSIPFISQIQIFNYLVLEKGQIAEKQFIQEDKQFKPQGRFSYKGFELKTNNFFRITNMELGLFAVNGYRDYGEYAYQKFNSITKTNAYLTYLTINLEFGKWKFRTGGLYASKDKSSSLNKAHNGYSPLLSDVRIFGGKSSFLLMENVNERNGTIFKDFDSKKENRYDTKGMGLASIGVSYSVNQNFHITGILNHTNSNLGIGNEGIISAMYQFSSRQEDNSSFLFASICAARVNPITQKKILYDEFRVDPSIKEFTRFYFSGGLYF